MKRLLLLVLFLVPVSAYSQGVSVAPQTATRNLGSQVVAMVGATVTVCAANATGLPCSPALSNAVFKNTALTQPLTNPFFADNNGNYSFSIAPGNYTVTVTSFGQGYSYQLTVPSTPGGTPTGGVTSVSCNSVQNVFNCTVSNPTTTAAVTFSPITSGPVLDCTVFPGAPDMGVQLNNCLVALPAAGGVADATHFTSPQTITTAVVNSISAVIVTCGISITQNAAITLSGTGSSWVGCPNAVTLITKNANLDQITLSGAGSQVSGLSLEGSKASFTGNGIVTASGCSSCQILRNTIDGEANDGVYDNSGTFSVNIIKENTITGWGVHGFQSTSTSQQSIFENNVMFGDGSSTGAAVLNGGSSGLYNNYVRDSNSVALVDDSTGGQLHPVAGNRLNQTNGWPALLTGNTTATGNTVNGGGAHGPAINTLGSSATIASNTVGVTNGDGIDVGNETTAADNVVNMNMSGVSGKCGINVAGDVIGARSSHNQIQISDNAADTNSGICSTPTGTHNLNNVFDGDHVGTTLSGGAVAYGFFMNNAANLNTNWAVTVENLGCVHLTDCVKRTDTQNNVTLYKDIQPGDTTIDAGTGSTNDIWVWDNRKVAFASLPSPAGDGSHGYCTNCSQAKPTTNAGSGALAYHEAGQWNGL